MRSAGPPSGKGRGGARRGGEKWAARRALSGLGTAALIARKDDGVADRFKSRRVFGEVQRPISGFTTIADRGGWRVRLTQLKSVLAFELFRSRV